MVTENWRAVPGYEGLYEVSDLGRVRSLPREVPCVIGKRRQPGTRVSPGRILKAGFPGVKYPSVSLFKNGVNRTATIHRLVLLAFVGDPAPGMEACHFNGDEHDNRLENLRWDTRTANRHDGRRLGEIAVGEARPMAKLTADQVRQIRARRRAGEFYKSIARDMPVGAEIVRRVATYETWKHIE